MKTWKFTFAFLVVIFIFTIVGCGSPETPTPTPTPTPEIHKGKALVESRCNTCHALGIVEAAKYDRGGWQVTVERMVASGAQINQEQLALVVDYLAITYGQ